MRLHKRGDIRYIERPLAACTEAGFSTSSAEHQHRHTSLFAVRSGKLRIRIIVDSEDSFVFLSPIIQDCDIYFCAGYSSDLFKLRRFVRPYVWQTENELDFYRNACASHIDKFGSSFDKIRPYVMIAPNLSRTSRVGILEQKYRNLRHKISSRISSNRDWSDEYVDFEIRYNELLKLRHLPVCHDVVLRDSLWGWPRHRVALHRQLKELSTRWNIRSQLNWAPPVACDGSISANYQTDLFPMQIGVLDDYETMLASSRLGVFATGFHWGWRNIMSFALMMGLPTMTDRLLVEPWFDMKSFQLIENEMFGMPGIETNLISRLQLKGSNSKTRMQANYDRYMEPEAVAQYVLRCVTE